MIIKDSLLGKYEIHWGDSFTIIENGVAIDKKTQEKKPKQTIIGYYSTLQGAVKEISKLLVQEQCGEVASLQDVINRFDTLWDEIKNTITI